MDLGYTGWLLDSEWFGVLISPFIGSFAHTAAQRHALDRSFVLGRSQCDHCRVRLAAWEMVPILSWIVLRGRCSRCSGAISWNPLFAESTYLAATTVTFITTSGLVFWVGCLLGWMLLALALVDLKTYLLPDRMTLPLIPLGLAFSALFGRETLWDHGLAAGLGFIGLSAVAFGYRILARREGLGMGDAKLFAVTGAWLGTLALPGTLMVAAGSALLVELVRRGRQGRLQRFEHLAFGPYLAFATWAGFVFGPLIPASA